MQEARGKGREGRAERMDGAVGCVGLARLEGVAPDAETQQQKIEMKK